MFTNHREYMVLY